MFQDPNVVDTGRLHPPAILFMCVRVCVRPVLCLLCWSYTVGSCFSLSLKESVACVWLCTCFHLGYLVWVPVEPPLPSSSSCMWASCLLYLPTPSRKQASGIHQPTNENLMYYLCLSGTGEDYAWFLWCTFTYFVAGDAYGDVSFIITPLASYIGWTLEFSSWRRWCCYFFTAENPVHARRLDAFVEWNCLVDWRLDADGLHPFLLFTSEC